MRAVTWDATNPYLAHPALCLYSGPMRAWLAAILVLAACGSSGSPATTTDASGSGGSADGSVPPGWTTLISRTWSLAPGTLDRYECRRIQVPTEMWINGFRSLSPLGTHHEVLTISNSTTTGDYDCSAVQVTTEPQMLYAAGLNTDDLVFPAGDAVHLQAGQYINLNLHLFNVSDNPISGESGVLVQTIDASQVQHEIDMTFSGTFNINVPSNGQPTTAHGGCTASQDYHVFALWPHMHQIATHQKFTVTDAGTATNLLDADYTFSEQRNYPMAETVIHKNDTITTTCTYVNTTGQTIIFGDSSTEEMCFTGIYKYPAGGGLFSCVSQ